MEHHSYAKSGSNKKWSIEEKRRLVEQRIAADELFSKYSPKHTEPWKKFKSIAKIGNYGENALRKQWLTMVKRYRVQKAAIADASLDAQAIAEQNREWEFFGLIHSYMNQKTTDLHSYALKEPNVEMQQPNRLAIASVYSCNEAQLSPHLLGVLNDHNFGAATAATATTAGIVSLATVSPSEAAIPVAPPSPTPSSEAASPSATGSEYLGTDRCEHLARFLAGAARYPTINSVNREPLQQQQELNVTLERVHSPEDGELICETPIYETDSNVRMDYEYGPTMIGSQLSLSNMRYSNNNTYKRPYSPAYYDTMSSMPPVKQPKKKLTEKEKYYKHRRHFERRMEQRMLGICTIAGEALKQLMPTVNVEPLVAIGREIIDCRCSCSSSSDEDVDVDEDKNEALFD